MNDREKLAQIEEWATKSLEGIRDDLEKSEHRGDFKRGCAHAMRHVLSVINPPPTPAIPDNAPEEAAVLDGPFNFIE